MSNIDFAGPALRTRRRWSHGQTLPNERDTPMIFEGTSTKHQVDVSCKSGSAPFSKFQESDSSLCLLGTRHVPVDHLPDEESVGSLI